MAIGFLEVQGFGAAMAGLDAMCKTAKVKAEAVDANNTTDDKHAKVPVVVQVKISGSIGDVKAALAAGKQAAEATIPAAAILTHSIAAHSAALDPVLKAGKLPPKGRAPAKSAKRPDAVGIVDIRQFPNAVLALNIMLSNAPVELLDSKKYLGGCTVSLVLSGSVSAVKDALDQIGDVQGVRNKVLITNPHGELFRFFG